jgi:hypothetical protein
VHRWGKRSRECCRQGPENQLRGKAGSATPAAVRQTIIDLKKQNPERGARRISDIIKRFAMVGASASTVQRTLKEQGLGKPVTTIRATATAIFRRYLTGLGGVSARSVAMFILSIEHATIKISQGS